MNASLPSFFSQQGTTQKLNDLLQSSTQSLLCGPTCQKEKAQNQLQQTYLTAQLNVQSAPNQLADAAKAYYTYIGGQAGYQTYLNSQISNSTDQLINTITTTSSSAINDAWEKLKIYDGLLINANNSLELYNDILRQNADIQDNINTSTSDVITNDRKSYYEFDGFANLQIWYSIFFWTYVVLVLAFIIRCLLINESIFKNYKLKLLILGLLIIYPYVIDFIALYVYGVFVYIYMLLPQNIYNNI